MVQFRFSLSSRDAKYALVSKRYNSCLKLNEEWIFQCIWKKDSLNNLKPHCVVFIRASTTDVVTISGFLCQERSFNDLSLLPEKQEFSNFMESESSIIYINMDGDLFNCNGSHYFNVEVTITSLSCLPIRECRTETLDVQLKELSNDFGRLLDPETCCLADVNLKCGDASIPAHKVILSARSPVFAAMFRNPMKENRENEVVIGDVDLSVLRLMLTYVYTAKLSDLTVSSASDLFVAADKYQLLDLKRLCCAFLKDNLTLENVLRILLFGDLYDIDLKSSAIDYICNTCKEFSAIEKTEEWKSLKKERSDLAVDILTSVVKAKEKRQ